MDKVKALVSAGVRRFFVKAGECVFTNQPILFTTPLGSCVAVTFHAPAAKWAAMYHAFLPTRRPGGPEDRPCQYVDQATESILSRFLERGVLLSQVNACIVGGSASQAQAGLVSVGQKNAELASAILSRHRVNIIAQDVRGRQGRTLHFYTATGETWVSLHAPSPPLIKDRRARQEPLAGNAACHTVIIDEIL